MKILVTGGLGYIGSLTCIALIEAGFEPIIVDNLCNSKVQVLTRIEALTGVLPIFYQGDIRDAKFIKSVFNAQKIVSVIHFAGLKSVGESVSLPLKYYDNNVNGSLVLFNAMHEAGVKSVVFSSSATVYGEPEVMPITEDTPTGATTNPYGRSKYIIEGMLQDLFKAQPDWCITILRYFNPVGAHPSGTMGEDPQGIPNNLMPFIAQVAVGRREVLSVFGDDYATEDGTGVRDYIHVMDLAQGHLAALKAVSTKPGVHIFNLGTGKGCSVLQMIKAFSDACKKDIAYKICPRRAGDIAQCWASTDKAERELNWKATRTLLDMTTDTWHWQEKNPQGYV
ncbi:UDP-glucose 4-epimerase [Psychromonas sp. CNPT3]|uniref:UDP-glucose 4-epimerase GalE n=1 Tax=Psychromonas sp. CNPT3 TaxID=314282 RepID=UPI00006E4239|nr:UDP-glucose 4-epimerase GalE [Psychromonas sp. CNPT3]AGH81086.1 UDP-glucose 4-epimerase [Psychromonas sp. CNPT3]